jgi:antitoxin (DNA-binding transcriptional repressor) of toxin-antitoxin stability system
MPTVTVEEAQAKLPELIDQLGSGEEIVITRNARPVARLVRQPSEIPHPVFGRGRGKVIIVSEDEDHLKGFEEYMP